MDLLFCPVSTDSAEGRGGPLVPMAAGQSCQEGRKGSSSPIDERKMVRDFHYGLWLLYLHQIPEIKHISPFQGLISFKGTYLSYIRNSYFSYLYNIDSISSEMTTPGGHLKNFLLLTDNKMHHFEIDLHFAPSIYKERELL